MSNPNDEFVEEAKEGGKKILKGLTKGGILFSKRLSEGLVNAQISQSREEQPIDKIKTVGTELGRAVVKGAVESTSRSAPEVLQGVGTIGRAIGKRLSKKKDENDL